MVCERTPHFTEAKADFGRSETGDWGDHITPFHSPAGTPGEWMNVENSVFGHLGEVYTGLGELTTFILFSPSH